MHSAVPQMLPGVPALPVGLQYISPVPVPEMESSLAHMHAVNYLISLPQNSSCTYGILFATALAPILLQAQLQNNLAATSILQLATLWTVTHTNLLPLHLSSGREELPHCSAAAALSTTITTTSFFCF